MRKFKLVILLVFLVVLVVFLLQNLTKTDIIFILWSFELQKAYLILGSLILGFLIGLITMFALKKNT